MYKTLIQTLLACFYAILAASPLEGGGVMIAARQIAFGGGAKGLSAKDYIQDGLIAMWDGIENAGWGVHDESATVWTDLTGNGHDIAIPSGKGMYFGANFLHRDTAGILNTGVPVVSAGMTVEMVIDVSAENVPSNNGRFLGASTSNYRFEIDSHSSNTSLAPRCYYRREGVSSHDNEYARLGRADYVGFWSVRCSIDATGVLTVSDSIIGKKATLQYPVQLSFYPSNVFLVLGSWVSGSSVHGGIVGNICRVAVYNRVLSDEETAYIDKVDKARFNI